MRILKCKEGWQRWDWQFRPASRGFEYFRQRVAECNELHRGIEEELVELENIFQRLEVKVCK
uniref:Uncharacterized protein n=1 Tax=Nelumbo nucifera TaxID=4432 RepID=A0A822ZNZ9_NELNU|nr:TPA_asm: hypothetical protein HUJ06_003465 [Nelumbo nucifera]